MICPFGTTEPTGAALSSTVKRMGISRWNSISPNWLQVWRRIRLITLARDERLDLMMALAAVASTPSEGSPR